MARQKKAKASNRSCDRMVRASLRLRRAWLVQLCRFASPWDATPGWRLVRRFLALAALASVLSREDARPARRGGGGAILKRQGYKILARGRRLPRANSIWWRSTAARSSSSRSRRARRRSRPSGRSRRRSQAAEADPPGRDFPEASRAAGISRPLRRGGDHLARRPRPARRSSTSSNAVSRRWESGNSTHSLSALGGLLQHCMVCRKYRSDHYA